VKSIAPPTLANFRLWFEYDWQGSEKAFRRALALNPNYAYSGWRCRSRGGSRRRSPQAGSAASSTRPPRRYVGRLNLGEARPRGVP